MTLENFFDLVVDNTNLYIYDSYSNLLSYYDGKNSIPLELNKRKVLFIEPMSIFNLAITVE